LSEDLPKQETFFTAAVAKAVETLRNLLNNDPSKLAQHILIDEKSVDAYVLGGWKWKDVRYDTQKSLRELVTLLNSVCHLAYVTCYLITMLTCGSGNDRH